MESGTDGFGSHCQLYTFEILYGESHGKTVYLSPNTSFEHNYTNEPNFIERLLEFINLHKYYQLPEDKKDIPRITWHADAYSYCERNLDTLLDSDVFRRLKSRFMENKVNPYDKSFYNVAVHIRRPNCHDSRIEGADTPDSYYLNVIDTIRKEHPIHEKPLRFHIYSQGERAKFDCYNADDVVFHLDESIEDTVNGLLFGDSLVTSGSSLSYICAIYSDANVYYKPFWHPPHKSWRRM